MAPKAAAQRGLITGPFTITAGGSFCDYVWSRIDSDPRAWKLRAPTSPCGPRGQT